MSDATDRTKRRKLRNASLKAYLDVCYGVKKHRELAKGQLRSVIRRVGSGGVDPWVRLSKWEFSAPCGSKITGVQFKKGFREHVGALQKGRCCYCRRVLVRMAHAQPIEHVLPRTHHPEFTFHFWNLAVACADCNLAKSSNTWGAFPKGRRYPEPAAFTETFHPRFHNYQEHVFHLRLEVGSAAVAVFKGITPQGRHLCANVLSKVTKCEILEASSDDLARSMAILKSFDLRDNRKKLVSYAPFLDELMSAIQRGS